ncbi:MAG: hypothetical protein K2K82_01755 [Muribaculaceae bacterium]|nr:hypothetical protein [Muribaculaceae bacterium]
MNQEDKEIREILGAFAPDQSSELDFMARLQNRMDTVDVVKDQIAVERRRNRRAIIIAALSGCLVGILLTLAIPLIINVIKPIILFSAMAAITIGVSIGTYYLCRILTPIGNLVKIKEL